MTTSTIKNLAATADIENREGDKAIHHIFIHQAETLEAATAYLTNGGARPVHPDTARVLAVELCVPLYFNKL